MQAFFIILTFLLSFFPILTSTGKESFLLLLIHSFIILISSISLYSFKNRPYSIFKMAHIFFLFFFGVAPILQFKNNIVLWGGMPFTEIDYIITSIWILIIICIYNMIYYILYTTKKKYTIKKIELLFSNSIVNNKETTSKESILLILIDMFILFIVLYVYHFNIYSIFFRGSNIVGGELLEGVDLIAIPQSIALIVNNFLRPMSVVIFLYLLNSSKSKFYIYVSFLLVLLIVFPLSLARFLIAAMYIPIAISSISLFNRRNVFVLSVIIGLLIIFPLLHSFRYVREGMELNLGFNFDMLTEPHFDAYSSLLRIIKYNITTGGNQLLGALLFFVPRSIWPSKPIGSGAYFSEELKLEWNNIACCYFAEGYINFGIIGIIIFTLMIAIISSSLDNTYWNNQYYRKNIFFKILYLISLGLSFFILRGDLMSSIAYSIGISTSVFALFYFLLFKRKYHFIWNKNKKIENK